MDEPLFGAAADPSPTAAPSNRVADWQVAQLRRALDVAGHVDIADRQRVVVELVGRPVSSLRELKSSEALAVVQELATHRPAARSSWDDRESDTWIDKL